MNINKLWHGLLCSFGVLSLGSSALLGQETPANKDGTVFDGLKAAGFSLCKGVGTGDRQKPASFYFLTSGKSTVYGADFALLWSNPRKKDGTARFEVSIEGNVASDESESEDAWRLRASYKVARTYANTYLSLKHESDRDFRTRKLSGEVLYAPIRQTTSPLRLQPYVGFEAGRTLSRGRSKEREDTVLRLFAQPQLKYFLRPVVGKTDAEVKSIPYLSVHNKLYHLPLEKSDDWHNFFEAELVVPLSGGVSFGLTYKVGEESPNFDHIDTFGGNIGIVFS